MALFSLSSVCSRDADQNFRSTERPRMDWWGLNELLNTQDCLVALQQRSLLLQNPTGLHCSRSRDPGSRETVERCNSNKLQELLHHHLTQLDLADEGVSSTFTYHHGVRNWWTWRKLHTKKNNQNMLFAIHVLGTKVAKALAKCIVWAVLLMEINLGGCTEISGLYLWSYLLYRAHN